MLLQGRHTGSHAGQSSWQAGGDQGDPGAGEGSPGFPT